MPLRFAKMHGLGNDFVLVSLFDERVDDPPRLARLISDRHHGVGSDGLILVGPPDDAAAHVRMRMYNPDGSRAQMCGNGVRCVAKYAYERGLARVNPLCVQTDRGLLTLDLALDTAACVGAVRVDMGAPILDPRQIPVALEEGPIVRYPIAFGSTTLSMTCVSMGNPHAIFFVPDVAAVPLAAWGPQIERHALFPERTNVQVVQVFGPDFVCMRTWERGAGLTQACGTGASAVCVAGVLNGLTARAITAELPGGRLRLEWDSASEHVFMAGPVVEVFAGEWPV